MKHIKEYESILSLRKSPGQESDIESQVLDILQECSDVGMEISYSDPSEFYINSLEREVVAIRISLYIGLFRVSLGEDFKFNRIKPSIEHLISYMKSIEYSNFIWRDDETDFNQHNRRSDSNIKQKQNYLPNEDDKIVDVSMTFLKDNHISISNPKHIKKYEAFSMHKELCDRCGKSTNGITTMSIFNEDVICDKCCGAEKHDPEYQAAKDAELKAVRAGIQNYKGAIPNYKPLTRK